MIYRLHTLLHIASCFVPILLYLLLTKFRFCKSYLLNGLLRCNMFQHPPLINHLLAMLKCSAAFFSYRTQKQTYNGSDWFRSLLSQLCSTSALFLSTKRRGSRLYRTKPKLAGFMYRRFSAPNQCDHIADYCSIHVLYVGATFQLHCFSTSLYCQPISQSEFFCCLKP